MRATEEQAGEEVGVEGAADIAREDAENFLRQLDELLGKVERAMGIK